jgi:hypothetical protein
MSYRTNPASTAEAYPPLLYPGFFAISRPLWSREEHRAGRHSNAAKTGLSQVLQRLR